MPAMLKYGVIGAPGGKRKNAGRTPEWLAAKCAKIVDRKKLVEFLAKVASGEDMEQVVTDKGEILRVPASIKDRIKAVEILLNRGFGKDVHPLEHHDESAAGRMAERAAEILKELENRETKIQC